LGIAVMHAFECRPRRTEYAKVISVPFKSTDKKIVANAQNKKLFGSSASKGTWHKLVVLIECYTVFACYK
jgi:hypothetical protein